VRSLDELPGVVAGLAREGDLIITMGAGSIGGVGDRILGAIQSRNDPAAAGGGRV
jgi:UDP-N-acetylmuramate--alanine ligase